MSIAADKIYRQSIQGKKFNPLKQEVMNAMVIDYSLTGDAALKEEIINRNLRLVYKVVLKRFGWLGVEDFMDMISIGNEALIVAVDSYKSVERDFAYYAYMSVLNKIRVHHQLNFDLIKTRIVKGERRYADYFFIDDKEVDFEIEEMECEKEMNVKKVIELLYSLENNEKYNKVKKRDIELFICHLGLVDGIPKTLAETGEIYGMTNERARQIKFRLIKKIRDNKEIMEYLKEMI